MAAGDGFSSRDRFEVDRAIRDAETVCRFEFSVYVGPTEGPSRPYAERLHAGLVAPDRSVLVMVDPTERALEVVTGVDVARVLDSGAVRLVVLGMQQDFAAGDLTGGLCNGLRQLAEHARTPRTLHTR